MGQKGTWSGIRFHNTADLMQKNNKMDCNGQYCGAGGESRGAEYKLPTGAEITNYGSGIFFLPQTWRIFLEKKSWLRKKIL